MSRLTVREKMVKLLDKAGAMTAKEIAEEGKLNYHSVRRELQWDTFDYFKGTSDGKQMYCLSRT